jgi:DNA segregation ATPase FtsK/SpoIIIE-like protein
MARKQKISYKKSGYIVLASAALLTMLTAFNATRGFLIGLFGWALCAYLPAAGLLAVFMIAGRKPGVTRYRALIYGLLFISIVCAMHVGFAKNLITGSQNYITAPLKGYATVGGSIASVLTAPLVLTTRDYGLSLALLFVIASILLFIAIYPLILKIRDGSPRKKKPKKPETTIAANPIPKKNSMYVSEIEKNDDSRDTPRIFEPKEPFEPDKSGLFSSILSEEDVHRRDAKDSFRVLYENAEPKREEDKPRLRVLDEPAKTKFAAEPAFRSRTLNDYPQPIPVAQPQSPRMQPDIARMPQAPETNEPPKPKKIITNPIEYINTPLRPEEYLEMVAPKGTDGYHIPSKKEQEASCSPAPSYNPKMYGMPAYAPPEPQSIARSKPAGYEPDPAYAAARKDVCPKREETAAAMPNFFGGNLDFSKMDLGSVCRQEKIMPEKTPVSTTSTVKAEPPQAPSPTAEERSGSRTGTETPAQTDKPVQQSIFGVQEAPKPYIKPKKYILPPLDLLKNYPTNSGNFAEDYDIYSARIQQTMEEFSIPATVTGAQRGPTFTRYELSLGLGCNIRKVANLQENLTMRLEVQSIRILAPIAGKNAFGIEIPNKERDTVGLRSILASEKFMLAEKGIHVALGKTLEGEPFVADLASMPHLLVAGATGTGKSVFINQLLISILYKYSPEDVRLILIDPKKVELSVYQNLPNMLIRETVKEAQHAINMLNWLTKEMDQRYDFLSKTGAVDIDHYNNSIRDKNTEPKMFRIVLVVDEMSDLMMKGRNQVEEPIVRIAQLGRACGIHLILATQRPTVNVITGLIKGNILARVAFSVKTAMDSRIILDEVGAESLLGKGDLIYSFKDLFLRMQGALVEPDDIRKICNFIRVNNEASFNEELASQIKAEPRTPQDEPEEKISASQEREQDFELLLRKILKGFILEKKASVSMAQAKYSVGYIRAKKLIDAMTDRGFISKEDGAKPREVLITMEEYEQMFGEEN